jgi:hypothetical protein
VLCPCSDNRRSFEDCAHVRSTSLRGVIQERACQRLVKLVSNDATFLVGALSSLLVLPAVRFWAC